MADERRMLSALERMRLYNASPQSVRSVRSRQSTPDSLDPPTLAASRSLEATPSRRKSSMLTLSHLTPATPVREGETPRSIASDAVRDIARELEAVEARLSVYRTNRDADEPPEGEKEVTKEEQRQESVLSVKTPEPKATQQAGEVADEVEHALANCDRLLQQAKLQASAASLTRSLHSSGGSRSATTMQRPFPAGVVASISVSKASEMYPEGGPIDPTAPTANEDRQFELQATARAMRALVVSQEREIEHDEAVVREQNQRTQVAQLQEINRKFESKKKMVLLALREQCEAETRAVIKQAIATHEQEQQNAVATLEEQMLAEREKMLNTIMARHEADTADEIKRVQVRLQAQTFTQKKELEKQLQQEFDDTVRQLKQDTEVELRRWEQKERLDMESNVLKRREQAATTILRAQEAKTNELKQEMQHQHTARETEELEKLKKALAFGAQAQLQQHRKQLEADHEQNMSDTRTEAAQTLEAKLTDLKQVLKIAHKQEVEQTKRGLEKRHRVAVMETHEQLEMQHRAQIAELTDKAAKELEDTLAALRSELEEQNQAKLKAFQETIGRGHRVRMQQLEMDHDRECDVALQRLRQEIVEANQRDLDAKLARMQQSKKMLLDEAVLFLSITPDDRSAVSGGTNTTEGLLQLKQLGVHLPNELQRAAVTLVRDFEELTEEQQILVEKISDTTGMYLTFKRQCTQLEAEVNELQSALQTMHSQLQMKDELAKKLYMANEALLKKLGLVEPQ